MVLYNLKYVERIDFMLCPYQKKAKKRKPNIKEHKDIFGGDGYA